MKCVNYSKYINFWNTDFGFNIEENYMWLLNIIFTCIFSFSKLYKNLLIWEVHATHRFDLMRPTDL